MNDGGGIWLSEASGNSIGGIGAGEGNRIVYNGVAGVIVATGQQNAILGNTIYGNAGLGIELGEDAVTQNDPGDLDEGPNALQNFPELLLALNYPALNRTIIRGTLDSLPNRTCRIEFFDNETYDPYGYGEGETFLGRTNVVTDDAGLAAFEWPSPWFLPEGHQVTATATDPDGNTSEFSRCSNVVPFDSVDLAISQAASANHVLLSRPLVYTVTVENAGPAVATGVLVEDLLPSALDFISAVASQGTCTENQGRIECQLGNLGVNESATIEITLQPTYPGLVAHTVSVRAVQFDHDPANNQAEEWTGLGVADLSLELMVDPSVVRAGEIQTNFFLVANAGPDAVPDAVLNYWFEPSLQFVSATTSQGTLSLDGSFFGCALGLLPVGSTAMVTFAFIPTRDGIFVSYPFVGSAALDLNPDDNVVGLTIAAGPGPGVLMFETAEFFGLEGSTQTITVVRTGGSQGTIGASYATLDGTAVAGQDYQPASGTLAFPPGTNVQSFTVQLLNNPGSECNKRFRVHLLQPTGGAVLAGQTNSTVTIQEQDDVFAYNLEFSTMTLVSINRHGTGSGNGFSTVGSLSADGRYLVFMSYASDLMPGDSGEDPYSDESVFVRDLVLGVTHLVSANAAGTAPGNAASHSGTISADGRFVAFASGATDLLAEPIPGSPNQVIEQIFVRDIQAAMTRLASVNCSGTAPGNGPSDDPKITASCLPPHPQLQRNRRGHLAGPAPRWGSPVHSISEPSDLLAARAGTDSGQWTGQGLPCPRRN